MVLLGWVGLSRVGFDVESGWCYRGLNVRVRAASMDALPRVLERFDRKTPRHSSLERDGIIMSCQIYAMVFDPP